MPWASGVELFHSWVGQYAGSGTGTDADFGVLQPVNAMMMKMNRIWAILLTDMLDS
jgi:hypothetical protein